MGALNNALPYTLITLGEVTIDSGLASVLNASMPIFTILLSHLLLAEERLRWQKLAGVLLGLAGVVVLVGPEALRGLGSRFWAQLAVVAAAVSYALAAIVGRRWLRGQTPLVSAVGQLSAGTLLMLPLSLLFDAPWRLPLPRRRSAPCSACRCWARRSPTCCTSSCCRAPGRPAAAW